MPCDELDMYECDAAGRYGAKPGYHDDILMTRAIALHVALLALLDFSRSKIGGVSYFIVTL